MTYILYYALITIIIVLSAILVTDKIRIRKFVSFFESNYTYGTLIFNSDNPNEEFINCELNSNFIDILMKGEKIPTKVIFDVKVK